MSLISMWIKIEIDERITKRKRNYVNKNEWESVARVGGYDDDDDDDDNERICEKSEEHTQAVKEAHDIQSE